MEHNRLPRRLPTNPNPDRGIGHPRLDRAV